MSGPKVDYAKLREQEMARLVQARGCRIRAADKIRKMINQIDSCLGEDADLMIQDPQFGPSCKKFENFSHNIKKNCKLF